VAVIAIDQGTTGTRAAWVDDDGRIVTDAYRTHAQHHPELDWVEHDVEEIWERTREVVLSVAAGRERPRGIALANQGETVVAWNRETGKSLGRAIVWQDRRTQARVDEFSTDADLVRHVQVTTGLRLDPYFSASKLQWLLEHTEGARALAARGVLCLGTLDAWLICRLTNGERFVTDVSTAARTMLFDIERQAWDATLCERFGIPLDALPEVLASDGDFGDVLGVDAAIDGVPIVVSVVDQPGALFGHGALSSGAAKATFGTGCFVYMNAGTQVPRADHGNLATIAWRRAKVTTYALDGGVFACGSLVTWLRDRLGLLRDVVDLEAILADAVLDGEVTCVPSLVGLGAPHWDRRARGAFFGLNLTTDRAELVRAVFRGLVCRVSEVVRAMELDGACAMPTLRVDGGLSRSRALMTLLADALARPVAVVEEAETTVLGIAYLALRKLGVWSSDDLVLRAASAVDLVSPTARSSQRDAALAKFDRAVELTRSWP